ncbi:MAG TPA: translation initiation factor 2, partial [Micromonosporaceae bacterium]|nr:translation initiation factor 2 [Micromonosporaceae bacterium]
GGFGPAPEGPREESTPAGYAGPPSAAPPPPDWRPEVVSPPPPPRRLPDQDLDALDSDERSARTLTYGIAMMAGAVLVIVSCLLCSRVLF